MTTIRRELILLPFLLLGVGLGYITVNYKPQSDNRVYSAIVESSPTPMFYPREVVEKMDSPNGNNVLSMLKNIDNSGVNLKLYTSSYSEEDKKLIFEKNGKFNIDWKIPYNTWSPDNAYFFIEEISAAKSDYYVFSAVGDLFSSGVQFININGLFMQKFPDYIIEEVTGWASPTLLIVNTKSKENKETSFWFDVQSQDFIQLSTYFN